MQRLKVIAFTYKSLPLKEFNRFFLHDENHDERLSSLKFVADLDGLVYLNTCNRIEFIFSTDESLTRTYLKKFFRAFRIDWSNEELNFAIDHALTFEGENALNHLYRVASSLDSLVIGEREIITQVRTAYERCLEASLTDDFLRIVFKSIITTAKKIYTDTKIAEQPVSVVSIAIRKLLALQLNTNSKFILIGAGETIQNVAKYLAKQSYSDYTIYNRTLKHATLVAGILNDAKRNVSVLPLNEISNYKNDFDVLITCTGCEAVIITPTLFHSICKNTNKEKYIIDLAVPADVDPTIAQLPHVNYIGINQLKVEAEKNLSEREGEMLVAEKIIATCLVDFRQLVKTRRLELKMKEVPSKIREIKTKALNLVFAKEIETLDDHSKQILTKVLDYMEKKCVSIPMVMAKEIILDNND